MYRNPLNHQKRALLGKKNREKIGMCIHDYLVYVFSAHFKYLPDNLPYLWIFFPSKKNIMKFAKFSGR